MSLSKIAAAEKNLSKPQDVREEMALVMAPYANWERFLVPAPLTITILGQLMLISTQKDFSLANRAPTGGFVHLRYPDSFRACLVQVSNKGWEAFKLAHKNMDQIRLYSGNVPGNLKNAVQVLFQGDEEDIADELPIELGQIRDTADNCVRLAKNVEQVFDNVMYMVGELLEACVNAESDYEDKRRKGLVELEILQLYKKSSEEELKEAADRKKDLKDSLKEAEESFKQASNDIPTGWNIIGMNLVEGLAKSVTTLTSIASICTILKPSVIGDAFSSVITSAKASMSHGEERMNAQTKKAFAKIALVESEVQLLKSWYLTGDGELDEKKLHGSSDIIAMQVSTRLGIIQASVKEIKENEVKPQIIAICEEGKAICSALEKIKKDIEIEANMASQIAKRISNLFSEATTIALQADMLLSSNATDKLPPNLEQASNSHASDEPTSKMAADNARYKVESAKGILKSSQEAYTASCDSLRENTKQLNKFMADIAKIDLQNIEFDEIKKTLKQGIRALAKLKEQWQNLVEFFSMMSNLIECSMSVSLQGFLDKAEKASERYEIAGYTLSDYRKDSIYKQAFNAAKIAYLVNMISKSYVEVSNKHLMHRIAGLAKLLAFDPETEQHAIQQAMHELTSGCTVAQQEIESLVMKNKAEFDASIKKRMNRIESEMKAVLPPPSQADAKLLEEAKQKCDEEVKKKVAVKSAAPDLVDWA